MATQKTPLRNLFLTGLLLLAVISCDKDDDPSPSDNLVGTWISSQSVVEAHVGAQTLTEYLINVGGLSPAEAGTAYAAWQSALQAEFMGSITFKSDKTYLENFGSNPEGGTWSLSSDGKTLTLDPGTADETVLTVNTLTSSSLNVTFTQDIQEDQDDDADTPDITIRVTSTLSLTK